MARSGRRFVIGAAGPLTNDESLGGGRGETAGFARGEVQAYTPPKPADVPAAEASGDIVVIMPQPPAPESGGDAAASATTGEGPGTGTGTGTGTGEDAGVEDTGGKIDGEGRVMRGLLGGEFVIQRSAVKKYGDQLLTALNEGKVQVMSPEQYDKGGKVGSGQRFAALESQLAGRAGVTNPAGLAASIGRRKYGKARYQRMAAAGR
jgi:hypothetical protein